MQISNKFTIAVHILTCINYFQNERAVTSDFLASSVGVNPVIIRQINLQLKAADLVEVSRGKGGMKLKRTLEQITLYDIYEAVESVKGNLFRFHAHPNPECPVGKDIHAMLDSTLADIQLALEEKMKTITLESIAAYKK